MDDRRDSVGEVGVRVRRGIIGETLTGHAEDLMVSRSRQSSSRLSLQDGAVNERFKGMRQSCPGEVVVFFQASNGVAFR